MKKGNLSILSKLADKVSEAIDQNPNFSRKNQILVSLGQSPAYLLEMIKLIDLEKGRTNRKYLNVAFSGSFYNTDGTIDSSLYREFDKLAPYYKGYLQKVGFSDQDLNETDGEFIVLEICHEGKGLKSFLNFFTKYRKKPNVLYLQHNNFEPIMLPVVNQRLCINDNEEHVAVALANADEFKDRMVPHFQFHKWQTIDPLVFRPEENFHIIMSKMQEFIKIELMSGNMWGVD